MRKLASFLFALFFVVSAHADDYGQMWTTVNQHLEKDMPKKAISALNDIVKKSQQEKNYGEYLAARMKYARVEAEVTPDSIIPAMKSLIHQAYDAERTAQSANATDNDKVLSAVYHALLAKLYNVYRNTGADTLAQQILIPDSIEYTSVKTALYDIALRHPDLLAACPYSSYTRFISRGTDDDLFGKDLLSVICNEADRLPFLRDYCLAKGNKRAAAIAEYQYLNRNTVSDDKAKSKRKIQLLKDMEMYKDIPEYVLIAHLYYSTIEDDDDIRDASRYLFLCQNIEKYEDLCKKEHKEDYINRLKTEKARLTKSMLNATVSDGKCIMFVRNLDTVDIEITRLDVDGTNKLSSHIEKDLKELKSKASKGIEPFRTTLHYTDPIYEIHSDTLSLPDLAPGVYLVSAKSGTLTNYELLYHSNLTLLSLPEAEKGSNTRIAVVYSDTGMPVAGAKVKLTDEDYRGKIKNEKELTTDEKGETHFNNDFKASYIRVYTDSKHATPDNAFRKVNFRDHLSTSSSKDSRDHLSLFLDRAIYRPGQTIKGAVVVHNSENEDSVRVKASKRILVTYKDADYNALRVDTIYSDLHGNAGFEFTLPRKGKNGIFTVSCSSGYSNSTSKTFRVEDYKRPTFTVEAIDKEKYNEPIKLTEVIDPDKKESIFMPGMPSAKDTTVTVRFQAKTYSQLPVQDASVVYSVSRTSSLYRWAYSNNERIIVPDSLVHTDNKGIVSISFPLTLPEEAHGYYDFTVHASVTDKAGETHEESMKVCVQKAYVKKDGKPVKESSLKEERLINDAKFDISDYHFPADGSVTFTMKRLKPTVKSSKACLGKVHALYTIFDEKKVIESGSVEFDTLYTRKFQYSKKYGEAITIAYTWVMDGTNHSYVTTIRKPQPDLKLNATWSSFRDRTQPGSNETWTLHVESADKKKQPVTTASLVATIYDKSLDAIVGRGPSFSTTVLHNSYWFSTNWTSSRTSGISLGLDSSIPYFRTYYISLPSFNDDILPYRSYYSRYSNMKGVRIRGKGAMYSELSAPIPEPMVALTGMAEKEVMDVKGNDEVVVVGYATMKKSAGNGDANDDEEDEDEDEDNGPKEDLSQMVRTNFNETAFFTPSLTADENGDINISFTLPESMTTWRFRGFVHDDVMRNTMVDAECVAKKDVIVRPNIPRYLREGDKGILEANIFNTTQKDLKTEVIMQFVKPETEAVIWEHKQEITLKAEGSEAVSFKMPEIPGDTLLIYRVVAKAQNGNSDGEQHYIPILPSIEEIVSTIAFTQHNTGTYTKDFANLLYEGSRNRKLTLKYTPHAVDFLIEAVPSVVETNSHDAISLSTAVYVGNMFRDCASRISGRNDSVRIDSLITAATEELKSLQLHNGSWSWWKGMNGSIYMTTEISKLLARLNYHGFANAETNKMLSKAMPYMLKFMSEESKEIRKYLKKYPKAKIHPSETSTSILYINALLRLNPENYSKGGATSFKKNDNKDIKFLIDLLEKVPAEFTIYGKAHSASVLSLYGRTKKAKEFIESMKEYSVCTEEAGRYYDSPNAYYSWRNYRIPTEVAAIEALRLVTPEDSVTVEEMQKWLLHEKRTQQWNNSANTADAVYAFILDNSEIEYIKENRSVKATHSLTDYADNKFSLNGKSIEVTGDKVQTAVIPVTNEHIFTAEKLSKGTSWGALFLEQEAPLSSIKTSGSGFSITRSIVENNAKVGDKITVRITIVADRDYDFVEVTDNRAACLEPVEQLSGYCSAYTGGTARGSYSGYYRETRDNKTNYYFDKLAKGTHVIDTEYYVDRKGTYQQGVCTVKCVYAPEFSAILAPSAIKIEK